MQRLKIANSTLSSGMTKLELSTSYRAKFDLSYPAVVLLDRYTCLDTFKSLTDDREVDNVMAD